MDYIQRFLNSGLAQNALLGLIGLLLLGVVMGQITTVNKLDKLLSNQPPVPSLAPVSKEMPADALDASLAAQPSQTASPSALPKVVKKK